MKLIVLVFVCCCGLCLDAAPRALFHPKRILVLPRDAASLRALNVMHATRQRSVLRSFPAQGGLQVLELAGGEGVLDAVARYQASGLARFAEPDYIVSAAATLPSDPRFLDGTQWALNNYGQNGGAAGADIAAPEAWDVRRDAGNVVVAIIDSGARQTHKDLAANLWTNPLDGSHGFNALNGSHDPVDEYGHGTILAGIIGAVTDNQEGVAGVAWGVKLMICKFLDSAGNGFTSDAVACIEFARTNGADVLNLSWGGDSFSASVSNALWLARAEGIVVAAAAGNALRDTDVTPFYPAGIQLDNIVAVGASTRLDSVWSLSNRGAASVHLFAPGAAIYSTGSSGDAAYGTRDGTSMASGFVAGALALLRQQQPGASPANLRAHLMAAVDRKTAFAGKCVSGGRLNLRRALDVPTVSAVAGGWPFRAQIGGVPGHRYMVSGSTNFIDWSALQTNFMPANSQWDFNDTQSTNLPFRFYRASPSP